MIFTGENLSTGRKIPLRPQQTPQGLGIEHGSPQGEAEPRHDPSNHPSTPPKRKYFPIQCCPISESIAFVLESSQYDWY
jgi:hypothetical protein